MLIPLNSRLTKTEHKLCMTLTLFVLLAEFRNLIASFLIVSLPFVMEVKETVKCVLFNYPFTTQILNF